MQKSEGLPKTTPYKKCSKTLMKKAIWFFNICVAVTPFLIAAVLAIIYVCGGWGGVSSSHDIMFYSLPKISHPILTIIALLIIGLFLSLVIARCAKAGNSFSEVAIIIFLALILRVLILSNKSFAPFSDFSRVWQMVHGQTEGHIEYYQLFPAYLNYTCLLKKYISVVGDHYKVVLIGNALLSSCTSGLVYIIALLCTSDKSHENNILGTVPLIAGLMYAFMPSNILYCSVMTPEFITIFFCCLSTILLLLFMKKEQVNKRVRRKTEFFSKFFLLLFAGTTIGISSSYKSFGSVIIIAFVLCVIAELILQKVKLRNVLIAFLGFLILFGGYKTTKTVILNSTSDEFEINLDEGTAVPHFLLVGLNTEGEGQIHIGKLSRQYYQYYLENGQDAEKARDYAFNLLKTDWKLNRKSLPALFAKKLIWTWQDDVIPVSFYNISQGKDGGSPVEVLGISAASITECFYLIVMMCGAIGAVAINSKNQLADDIDYKVELIMLIIFGFFCLMILSEAQSRYKCLVMPFLCVISAFGWQRLINKISNRIERFASRKSKKDRLLYKPVW